MGTKPLEVIPYAKHEVTNADIAAVTKVLRTGRLTSGPVVEELEDALTRVSGAKYAVACSSGTSALRLAALAVAKGMGSRHFTVSVPNLTFCATAYVWSGLANRMYLAEPDGDTGLALPGSPEGAVVVAVDYAGLLADYHTLKFHSRGSPIIADSSHALGAVSEDGLPIGKLADLATFSFHPAKHVTGGEGGAVVTNNKEHAELMRRLRNHGITSTEQDRAESRGFEYDVAGQGGFNYRMSEVSAALTLSQLRRLDVNLVRRLLIAGMYQDAFSKQPPSDMAPLHDLKLRGHAWHLYVLTFKSKQLRDHVFKELWKQGIRCAVHYPPISSLRWAWENRTWVRATDSSHGSAMDFYSKVLSLPMYPSLTEGQQERVIRAVRASLRTAGTGAPGPR